MTYPLYQTDIPYITTEQMREVDRAMIEDYGIDLIQMMENAGRNLAHLARDRFLGGNPTGKKIVVLAGKGGNGGGALVCARRLHNYGADVRVFVIADKADFTPIPQHQFDILDKMGVWVQQVDKITDEASPDLIIDGVIGYSLKGNPREKASQLIQWANDANAPILALDAPSGLDTTTGTIFAPAIQATATMTLALPKIGLRGDAVEAHVGELYLADISVPPSLYASPALNLDVPAIFAQSDIVRLS